MANLSTPKLKSSRFRYRENITAATSVENAPLYYAYPKPFKDMLSAGIPIRFS